jgi:hypothetical protein
MGYLSRSVDDAIAWSEKQITNPSQDWYNLCQSHCRQAYGVGAWASSAWEAWNTIPSGKKTATSNPGKAPRGSLIYYKGGSYGHVTIAIGKSTTDKVLTNDYVRHGKIDKASTRDLPRWGLTVVGWSYWTPVGEMKPWDGGELWDGVVPSYDGVLNAQNLGYQNPQAYRLACRLFDLGMFNGTPAPEGTQGYPRKAVANWQASRGYDVQPPGEYGPKAHDLIFP